VSVVLRILRRLDSETLHVPELRDFIGKDVEIVVSEVVPQKLPDHLVELEKIAGKIDLDFEAIEKMREISKI
jgi:hypothetical protein